MFSIRYQRTGLDSGGQGFQLLADTVDCKSVYNASVHHQTSIR